MLHSNFEVSILIRGLTPHILRQNSYFAPPLLHNRKNTYLIIAKNRSLYEINQTEVIGNFLELVLNHILYTKNFIFPTKLIF